MCTRARTGFSASTRLALYTARRAVNTGHLPHTALTFAVHGVLAGAYLGGPRSDPKRTLTHAAFGDDLTAICGRVRPDTLGDLDEPGPPTCRACAQYVARLVNAVYR